MTKLEESRERYEYKTKRWKAAREGWAIAVCGGRTHLKRKGTGSDRAWPRESWEGPLPELMWDEIRNQRNELLGPPPADAMARQPASP